MSSVLTVQGVREIEDQTRHAQSRDLASYLQETLGQKMAAYLAGVKDPKMVGRWARGVHEPRSPVTLRLQTAYEVTRLLTEAFNAETAKSWLVGSNSRLDDEAPAWLIRHSESVDDVRGIVPTARAFVGAE